jgi:stage V sporulation protein G
MNITGIYVTLRDEEKLKAFVNVVFDNCFVVRGLKVIKGRDSYFIAMPSRKHRDGGHREVAHPIKREMRLKLEQDILDAYRLETERNAAVDPMARSA